MERKTHFKTAIGYERWKKLLLSSLFLLITTGLFAQQIQVKGISKILITSLLLEQMFLFQALE